MGYSVSQPTLFSLLPRTKTPWKEFVFSSGSQALVVAFLIWLRVMHPGFVSAPEHSYTSVHLVSTAVRVSHQPQPSRPLPRPIFVAVVPASNALRLPSARLKPLSAKSEEAPAPLVKIAAAKISPLPLNAAPVAPKIVATNVFSSGSSAAPTVSRSVAAVQTGGFGDPQGIPAKANPGKPINIAAAGSFDLPSGAGYGNGTAGAKGIRGVISSAGFGNGVAISDSRSSTARSTVQASGFGDADVPAPPTVHSRASESIGPSAPAEIISKPTPVYTSEARKLRIEGEVLLEVLLQASGNLQVVRVVQGLGHGLDDNAVKAAEQIRFKPATRNGQPADSKVVLHIIFQLA